MPAAIRLCKTAALLLTLTAACTRTDISHTYALAKYQKGDYQTAFTLWQRLAEQGRPEAQYWLGTLYRKGEGVKKDSESSARWQASAAAALQPLAEQGQPPAQYLLGLMTGDGHGVEKNAAQSERWLRRAAKQGYGDAQHALGMAYFHGRNGLKRNASEAARWCVQAYDALLPLADTNNADAQYRIAVLYRDGCGLAKDRDESRRWLRKAARRGHVEAQFNAGMLYSIEFFGKRDRTEAFKWTRRAAEKGHVLAQSLLAMKYEKGDGVRQSKAEAQAWYRKAAEQGDAVAQKRLDAL